ncbi:MAG: hypothetical protein J5787_01960 [Alphaproteobacteria bacterium]|nr:hypothetical protein [Alphaproteobacteria bacterium]
MLILNINGPINAGKTTVSRILEKLLPDSLFIEVDNLLSEDEAKQLGLSMDEAFCESVDRLERLILKEKEEKRHSVVFFAYPIGREYYDRWKGYEDEHTRFFNVTLSPSEEECLRRGGDDMSVWEHDRILQMYEEGCHNPGFSDLIIHNDNQTPEETARVVLDFLEKIKTEFNDLF